MPRVALLVPYFPPDSTGGVFRALKLIRLLPDHGWQPTVFTVENPGITTDETLLKELPSGIEVFRIPANVAQKLQRGSLRKLGFAFEALGLAATAGAQWENLARELITAHDAHPFDLIFSTSPPPASHRAVLTALAHWPAERRPAWVADFRDPWRRGFTYRPASNAESMADVRDEGRTLFGATLITATTYSSMLASCMEHSLNEDKLVWVPNGYDPEDIAGLPLAPAPPSPPTPEHPLRFGYAGSMYGAYNINLFLDGLEALLEACADLRGAIRLDCYGARSKPFVEKIGKGVLKSAVQYHGYAQHRAVLEELSSCHWVIASMPQDPRAQDTVSGKLYEYLAARIPVLAFASSDGAIAKLLRETGGGRVISTQKHERVAAILAELAAPETAGPILPPPGPGYLTFLERYSRATIAEEFARVFRRAVQQS